MGDGIGRALPVEEDVQDAGGAPVLPDQGGIVPAPEGGGPKSPATWSRPMPIRRPGSGGASLFMGLMASRGAVSPPPAFRGCGVFPASAFSADGASAAPDIGGDASSGAAMTGVGGEAAAAPALPGAGSPPARPQAPRSREANNAHPNQARGITGLPPPPRRPWSSPHRRRTAPVRTRGRGSACRRRFRRPIR